MINVITKLILCSIVVRASRRTWNRSGPDGVLYQPVLAASVGHEASSGGLAAYVRDVIDRKAAAAWSCLHDEN
jgi:hypothetical protein